MRGSFFARYGILYYTILYTRGMGSFSLPGSYDPICEAKMRLSPLCATNENHRTPSLYYTIVYVIVIML